MKKNILIIGNGRIARAVDFYLKASGCDSRLSGDVCRKDALAADLFVGSMPGDLGHIPLEAALKFRKDLVDISDMEPAYFLKHKRAIIRAGITVIPACGFCPGLVNFLVGREKRILGTAIRKINIMAGSLSDVPDYFPFLWCFEDLALEHTLSSEQIVGGRRLSFPAFAGYRHEAVDGIQAESYYTQSGFENMMDGLHLREFTYRVLRPRGFGVFYRFLRSEGFFAPGNMMATKAIVEKNVRKNITVGRIGISTPRTTVVWQMKSRSQSGAVLNSMQKITAATPAAVSRYVLARGLPAGLFFMEDLAHDDALFRLIKGVNARAGVTIVRKETRP